MKKFFNTAVLILLLCSLFISCDKKKKSEPAPEVQVEVKKADHGWYYFTNKGYFSTDKIDNIPESAELPWTEAVRISSANNANDDDKGNLAFAIVNRLGVLTFEGEKVSLGQDLSLFADRTAGNLVFLNGTPVFSVYKSAFFNETITAPAYHSDNSQHLFLVQYDPSAKISYPLISCNNITDLPDSEIIDYSWDGLNWLCSVKTFTPERTKFSYLKWYTTSPLLSLSPGTASDFITVQESSVEEFRAAKELLPYKKAPERIKKTLEGFSSDIPFILEVKWAGGSSAKRFENDVKNSDKAQLNAKAIISESWSAVLFEDGTMYIEGALPGKHILRGGKPVAIRLPKLPSGYIYSDFVISGTTLYAAWEEAAFYKTKKSGFLSVDLDSTLYSRLR